MTIEEFKKTGFRKGDKAKYYNTTAEIIEIEFVECLLGLRQGKDEIEWVRCESVIYIPWRAANERMVEIRILKTEKMSPEKLADKMIKEMQDAGLSPDQMLKVIHMAREKFKQMKNKKKNHLLQQVICFFKGHKPVKMLIENDRCIYTSGCKRCKLPLGLPATWKLTPCPPWSNEDEWRKFKEADFAKIRASVNEPEKRFCNAPKDFLPCNVNDDGICKLATSCDYQRSKSTEI